MYRAINKEAKRIDAFEKVTGRARFAADLNFTGQLYAQTVYSKFPHARIITIDTEEAQVLPGVVEIITAADVPGSNVMFGRFPVLAAQEVKYIGDGVAVVAAESRAIATEAAKLVRVKYEELPAVLSVEEALAANAPRVHEDAEGNLIEHAYHLLRVGDVEEGFARSEVVLERSYRTRFIDQAYIEPEAVIALPDPYRRGVEIHGSIQNPYSLRRNLAAVLSMKISAVKVVHSTIGGSFGGKDESVVQMAARVGILALATGRPVKMVLTREESLLESSKRHPFNMHYRIGSDKDGTIKAVEARIYVQGGAYNNKAQFTNWRGSIHASGPYNIPHIKTDIYGVYTNTIYGGAMRGFSAPQILFAQESLIDELAAELCLSPQEIRLKNCLKPGHETPSGQELGPGKIPVSLEQMIKDLCRRTAFEEKRKEFAAYNIISGPLKRGIGLACTFRGAGLGGEGIDTASAVVTIDQDGSVNIISGLTEMGQGMRTAHAQIVAEVLGISLDRITFNNTDTSISMDSGPTVASRGTLAGGSAMLLAGKELVKRLHARAAGILQCQADDLVSEDDMIYCRSNRDRFVSFEETVKSCLLDQGISLSAQGWYNPGPEELSKETGRGRAYPTYVYGCSVVELKVDTETGKVDVLKITSAHDVGTAINPQLIKGQIYGGNLQGLGYGLLEEVEERDGRIKTGNFDDLLIPTIKDMPEIEVIIYETDDQIGPYGAKSVGELGVELITPAIANAIYQATSKRLRELPLSMERLLLGRSLSKE